MNPSLPPNQPPGQPPPQATAQPADQQLGPVQQPPAIPPPPDDGSHKQALYDNFKYSTEEFDKTLLYVMSGMLAVSFAFIEKITPLETALEKSKLLCGWILLSTGILLYLLAHFILPFFYDDAINLYDEHITPEQTRNRKITNSIVHSLNAIMLALTIAGSVLIMYFIKTNFNEKGKVIKKEYSEESSRSQTPHRQINTDKKILQKDSSRQ